MRPSRQDFINDLVGDLRPVRRPGRVGYALAAWLAIAIVYSVGIVVATGPLRPGALHDLVAYPAFAVETLLAVAAIFALPLAALLSSIPAAHRPVRLVFATLIPLGLWVGVYVVGLRFPAHPVSELGNRSYCIWQAVLFSLPSFALILWIARRQFPLWPRTTAFLAGTAAAAIPAELMQFACMYVPGHILTHHLTPMLITAALGALVGPFVLRARRTVPRHGRVPLH